MGHFRKNLISIFFNDSCNMRCIYCPIHSKKLKHRQSTDDQGEPAQQIIDLAFAKRGIDDFFRNTDSRGIRLFANGEPTLAFDRMREVVEYAQSIAGKDLYLELQSNGLFPTRVADWISDHIDMLWLSLDGTEDIQNRQRQTRSGAGSFSTIDRNVQRIRSAGRTRLGLRPTITSDSVDRQQDLIDYAADNGIIAIYAYPWVNFVIRWKGMPELQHFADQFLEARRYGQQRGVHYGTIFTVNFDESVKVNCRALLPAPHLTPDGYVSCCDMMNRGDGMFQDLIYGVWDADAGDIVYFPEKIENIRSRNVDNLTSCHGCPALEHCAGGCVGAGIASTGDFLGVNEEYCHVTRYLFERLQDQVGAGYDPAVPLHP